MLMIRDLVTDQRTLALVSIGCAAYLVREAYYHHLSKKKGRQLLFQLHGYERPPPEQNFPDLRLHNNLLAAHLTPELYYELRTRVTCAGYTLDQAIQDGVDNPGSPWERLPGVTAGDEDTYKVFGPLFDPIINSYHNIGQHDRHVPDLDASKVVNGHFTNPAVLSVRISGRRCLSGYRFPISCGRGERKWLENTLVTALKKLQGEFKGEYHPLEDIPQDEQLRFTIAGTLCHVPNNKTLARDWPEARGLFYTADQSFVVWVNTTDHVQVTCLSASGDLESVFGKYSNGMTSLERELERDGERFSLDKRLGYIVSDPKHLGTALKVTVRVRLPHLLHDCRLHYILKALKLRRVGTKSSQESDRRNGVLELYNAVVLGASEVQIVQSVADGVQQMLSLEKMLERRQDIQNFLPTIDYEADQHTV